MRAISLALFATLVLTGGSAFANGFVEIAGEFQIPLPDGWAIDGDTTGFPIHLAQDSLNAHLSIFKSELTDGQQLRSERAFRKSVTGIIDSVVMQLPNAVLVTNTGYNEGQRAVFVVEFNSVQLNGNIPLRHYLVGLLYTRPDGYQVLFSLWGRTVESRYAAVKPDFEQMRRGFRYLGPAKEKVFSGTGYDKRWLILLLVGMLAVLLLVRHRRGLLSRTTASAVPTWRCTCGQANRRDDAVCRRCGAPRPERFR